MSGPTGGTAIPDRPQVARDSVSDELAQLRFLLVGPERAQLNKLRERLEDPRLRAEDVSQVLADAIRICAARDKEIGRSLSPVIEIVLKNLVRQEPAILTDTIYPIIGRSIRKAISAALQGMAQSLNRVVEQSLSVRGMQWRMEAWRTGKSYGEIVLLRSLLYRVEQVFLIHRETGLLLQQAAVQDAARDPDLVSSMLVAIQDFVRDSFSGGEKDELDTIQVGDLGIWIQYGPRALLAGVVRGVAPRELSNVLQEALETIHREQQSELESFTGDVSAFEAARPQLESCLLGNAKPKNTRPRMLAWAIAGIAILAVLSGLALLGLSVRDTRRWTRYVERLENEPGILVTNAERRGGRYFIKGLRDPYSEDPSRLLRDAQIDPQRVTWRWEPILSEHPRLVALRRFDEEREKVEQRSIYFSTGSSEIVPGQLAIIDEVSAAVRALLSAAQTAGWAVRLEVIGHSDPPGTRDLNSRLSAERASRVLKLLADAGVPGDRLVARAVPFGDASRNMRGAAAVDFERRVSFRVVTGRP